MATSVSVNLIHIFVARLNPVWYVITVRRYREYRFWRTDDAREAFTQYFKNLKRFSQNLEVTNTLLIKKDSAKSCKDFKDLNDCHSY